MTELTPQILIDLLGLEPLAHESGYEGGYYSRSYLSKDVIPQEGLPSRYRSAKPTGSAIYFLLTDDLDSFSALHRLPTDEIYHFYLGDPVALLLLHPDGGSQQVILGQDILSGEQMQFVAPAGSWQGSRLMPGGRYALMGTTMAPAFTPDDYGHGNSETLLAQYPDHAEMIRLLTRKET
ncbi:MAG: cupin domain-containing protein [Anaerolineales bacterium]|jgi:predicted cupin superfamily sugar epimerase